MSVRFCESDMFYSCHYDIVFIGSLDIFYCYSTKKGENIEYVKSAHVLCCPYKSQNYRIAQQFVRISVLSTVAHTPSHAFETCQINTHTITTFARNLIIPGTCNGNGRIEAALDTRPNNTCLSPARPHIWFGVDKLRGVCACCGCPLSTYRCFSEQRRPAISRVSTTPRLTIAIRDLLWNVMCTRFMALIECMCRSICRLSDVVKCVRPNNTWPLIFGVRLWRVP